MQVIPARGLKPWTQNLLPVQLFIVAMQVIPARGLKPIDVVPNYGLTPNVAMQVIPARGLKLNHHLTGMLSLASRCNAGNSREGFETLVDDARTAIFVGLQCR